MAVVRHFAFNLLRLADDRRSMKLRRKRAARNNQYLAKIRLLQPGRADGRQARGGTVGRRIAMKCGKAGAPL
jgi:hypothetical protein